MSPVVFCPIPVPPGGIIALGDALDVLSHICSQRWSARSMACTCSLTCSSPSAGGLAPEFSPEQRLNSSPSRFCMRIKCPNDETALSSGGGSGEADASAVMNGPPSPTATKARGIGTPYIRSSMPP
jgi:hypothetical protein